MTVAQVFFWGVLGTRFGALELKIGSLQSEKIIIGSLESREIGSLQVHTGYLTFSLKKNLLYLQTSWISQIWPEWQFSFKGVCWFPIRLARKSGVSLLSLVVLSKVVYLHVPYSSTPDCKWPEAVDRSTARLSLTSRKVSEVWKEYHCQYLLCSLNVSRRVAEDYCGRRVHMFPTYNKMHRKLF